MSTNMSDLQQGKNPDDNKYHFILPAAALCCHWLELSLCMRKGQNIPFKFVNKEPLIVLNDIAKEIKIARMEIGNVK